MKSISKKKAVIEQVHLNAWAISLVNQIRYTGEKTTRDRSVLVDYQGKANPADILELLRTAYNLKEADFVSKIEIVTRTETLNRCIKATEDNIQSHKALMARLQEKISSGSVNDDEVKRLKILEDNLHDIEARLLYYRSELAKQIPADALNLLTEASNHSDADRYPILKEKVVLLTLLLPEQTQPQLQTK